jgi:hypothetical protein
VAQDIVLITGYQDIVIFNGYQDIVLFNGYQENENSRWPQDNVIFNG